MIGCFGGEKELLARKAIELELGFNNNKGRQACLFCPRVKEQ